MKTICITVTDRHIQELKSYREKFELGASESYRRILDFWIEYRDKISTNSANEAGRKIKRNLTIDDREVGEVYKSIDGEEVYLSEDREELYTERQREKNYQDMLKQQKAEDKRRNSWKIDHERTAGA